MMADRNREINRAAPAIKTEAPPRPPRKRTSPPLPQDPLDSRAGLRSMPARVAKALEHAKLACRLADDNRGKDILLLDLRAATPLIDFFIIASANSRRQAYAIASEIDQELKKFGEKKLGMEGAEEGRWILTDYGDFVVHVFSEDARTYYALEEIWGDAERVEWRDPERARRAALIEQTPPEIEEEDEDDNAPDFEAPEVS